MEKIHIRDLPTLSTEALEEMLERQNRILGKSCVMCKLIDKGESVRKFHSAILTELNKRKTDNKLSESLSELNIKNPAGDAEGQTERHIQYVCAKESLKPIEHFRPFAIAKHEKENRQGTSNEAATVEPRHTFHTKLIPLNESLVLQKDQAKRVKEEQMKKYLGRMDFFEGTEEAEEEPDPDNQIVTFGEDVSSN